jgi:hypothetical protein
MILDLYSSKKRLFNPKSKKDISAYKNFLYTNGWGIGGCPFFLVFPYSTVPHMIQDKIIHSVLGVENDKSRY